MRRRSQDGGEDGAERAENAFRARFLERMLDHDQPATAHWAASEGPWEVAAAPGGRFRVDAEEAGDEAPAALVEERQTALLLAAALPGSPGRELYRLRPERGEDGYELVRAGRPVGRLGWFDPHLVATLAALERIVSSPRALALVLEAAGHDALRRAGRLLAARQRRPPS